VKGILCGFAVMFGMSLAPALVLAPPAGQTSPAAVPVSEISGLVRASDVRPLFSDVPAGGYLDHFPFGQCTWWAAFNVRVTWWGDAGTWLANARAAGRATSPSPAVHSIVVYAPSRRYSQWGHVGVVTAVGPAGFEVSEMNYADGGRGTGTIDQRQSPWPDGLVEGFILPD
jgi:hypothetical protein